MSQNPSTIVCRCWVSGRVQGVYYRASTRQQATRLGVHGYARNLPDGRVEVLMAGSPEATRALIAWLWKGPPAASVSQVEIEEIAAASVEPLPASFVVQ